MIIFLSEATYIADDKSWKTKKLKLAVAWNKYDLVENDILNNQNIMEWSRLELDNALKDALYRNSITFIEILIECGASFERLQRLINLKDIYQNIVEKIFSNSNRNYFLCRIENSDYLLFQNKIQYLVVVVVVGVEKF